MNKSFTITLLTENTIGLLVRITTLFSRRRISIESLNCAATEVEGIHRFTILILETEEATKKLVQQLNKQVDVFKAFYHSDDEVVWQEQVLYKMRDDTVINEVTNEALQRLGARRIGAADNYHIFEVTGSAETATAVAMLLNPYCLHEIVKGARVSIINSNLDIHTRLRQLNETTGE